MKKTPAIAQHRRQEATAKFSHKLDVLEKLIIDGNSDKFPKRISISSFAAWKDPELGVSPVSRSVIYDKSTEYMELCQQMEYLLEKLAQIRAKRGKKTNLESELRKKLKDAQELAQSYVNQYSIAIAELSKAKKEIEHLNNKLRRQITSDTKVSQLGALRKSRKADAPLQ
jgi:hypothetical protein